MIGSTIWGLILIKDKETNIRVIEWAIVKIVIWEINFFKDDENKKSPNMNKIWSNPFGIICWIPNTKNFEKLLNVLLKLFSLNENWLDSIPDCKYSVTNSSSNLLLLFSLKIIGP